MLAVPLARVSPRSDALSILLCHTPQSHARATSTITSRSRAARAQNADSDLMLARRIRRDIAERGRDVEGVLDQYLRFVKRSYDNFVYPSSKYADLVGRSSSLGTPVRQS